jgi:hypothetical protein
VTVTTRDGLVAAQVAAQRVRHLKTASRTSVAAIPFSVFDLAGDPGAGVLAGTSTAAGVVPTDATAGAPLINAFTGANKGLLTRAEASNTVPCRIAVYDLLFKAGAYAFNSNVTLAAQPSYSSRVPGGTDFTGLEIWVETVTAFTGLMTVTVTYTNQSGTTGRTTGAIATGVAPTLGRMIRLNLQAGDTGVQKIESVLGAVATVGTFNVLVMRKIWEGRVRVANDQVVHGPDLTGIPEVFADSCLVPVVIADSTSTGLPEVVLDVANG